MNIKHTENYIFISSEGSSFSDFFNTFEEKHSDFEKNHLIIEISDKLNTSDKEILLLLQYAIKHKKNGTSFVVVYTYVNIDNFPETFNIVPTLIEAEDVIEMENIERDLGF